MLIKLRAAALFARGELPSDDEPDDVSHRFIFALLADAERLAGSAS